MKKFLIYGFILTVLLSSCQNLERTEIDDISIPTMSVTGEKTLDVPRAGGEYFYTVSSSERFYAGSTETEWIQTDVLAESGENNVKVTVLPNTSYWRDATVTIDVLKLPSYKIALHQDGRDPNAIPFLIGRWLFEDASNLGLATEGSDLTLTTNGGATLAITSIAGPTADNKAVKKPVRNYFVAVPGVTANGGGTRINEYTLLWDYRLPIDYGKWHCLLQTNIDNADDGEVFFNTSGYMGVSAAGYSGSPVPSDKAWHRIVMIRSGNNAKFYMDGALFLDWSGKMATDDRFSIDPKGVILCGDNDGEDNELDIAEMAMWRIALSDEQAQALSVLGAAYPELD